MIRESTGKKPTRLPESFWSLLRSVSPIRTIEEEQRECFRDTRICAVPRSVFARTTDRALRACLALLQATKDIRVLYVNSSTGKLDVFYDAKSSTLKIHHRWLDFDNVHQATSCRTLFPNNIGGNSAPYFCGHVVEELLALSISSIFKASPLLWATEMRYMRQIRRLIRLLPHSITISSHPGGLQVTWEDNEAESFRKLDGFGADYVVVLHAEQCTSARAALLRSDTGEFASLPTHAGGFKAKLHSVSTETAFAPCGCRQQVVLQTHRWCVFANMDISTRYYAIICLNERSAIYGLPSELILHGSQG